MRNIIIVLMIHMLFLVGCEKQHDANFSIPNIKMKEPIANNEIAFKEVPVDSVKGITSEEALKLCQNNIGEIDDEKFIFQMAEIHTGRRIGYRCDGAMECNAEQYYIIVTRGRAILVTRGRAILSHIESGYMEKWYQDGGYIQ